ncbi:MAG: NACHT domain-containing protein, partial [Egibacteraceae bacterium]
MTLVDDLTGMAGLAAKLAAALGKRGVKAVLGDEQERALLKVCERAVKSAVRDAAVIDEPAEGWLDEVAAGLAAALDDSRRVESLIRASLGQLPEAALRAELRAALAEHRDLDQLQKTVDVDRLLELFSSTFWDELAFAASKPGSPLAPLREHTLLERILARLPVERMPELSAEQIHDWLEVYLLQVDARARQRPRLHPTHVDQETLDQRVRVRTKPLRFMPRSHGLETGVAYLPKGVDDSEGHATTEPWATIREQYSRLVVLGEPGYGKTWLLRSEARRLARAGLEALKDQEDLDGLHIPVWIRLDELVHAVRRAPPGQRPLAGALVESLHSQYRLFLPFVRWLADRIDRGPCVLLLDALDEVTQEADRAVLANTLPGWARNAQNSRVIVTSRLAGYTGPPLEQDVKELELVPFSPAEVEWFITGWFPSVADAERLRAHLRDNPAVHGMTRIPLLLTLLCILASDPKEPLPTRRAELYERVIRDFLARRHRSNEGPDEFIIEATLKLLERIAVVFADRSQWIDLMPLDQLCDAVRNAGHGYTGLTEEALAGHVRKLAREDGVLVPAGNPSDGRSVPYLFLHRTFHEYLVARHLSHLPPEEWWRVVEAHLWFEPQWEEVIALLGGLLLDPDLLLDRLLQIEDDPLFAALNHAGRAVAEIPPERASSQPVELTIGRLVETLRSFRGHRAVGFRTLRRLLGSGNQVAFDTVLRMLSEPGLDERIWEDTLRGLTGATDPRAIRVLTVLLDHRDERTRGLVAVPLARRGNPKAIDVLIALRHNVDEYEDRLGIAQALVTSGNSNAMDAVLALLDHPDEHENRRAVAEALGKSNDPKAVNALITLLDDFDSYVRLGAASALAARDEPRAVEVLNSLLDNPDSYVRLGAASALAARDEPRAIEVLTALLGDPDQE